MSTTPPTPTIVSLKAQPWQVAHLSFAVGGVIDQVNVPSAAPVANVLLGATVSAFQYDAGGQDQDYDEFCEQTLLSAPTVTNDPSLLSCNAAWITSQVGTYSLMTLRSGVELYAALDNAISLRQNAYFAKYSDISGVVDKATAWYSDSELGSKPQRLDVLAGVSEAQWHGLDKAYAADNLSWEDNYPAQPGQGVVKQTESNVTSYATETYDLAANQISGSEQVKLGANTPQPVAIPEALSPPPQPPGIPGFSPTASPVPPVPPASPPSGPNIANLWSDWPASNASMTQDEAAGLTTTTGPIMSTGWQHVINKNFVYRIPYLEAYAQFQRSQISLIDQRFAEFMRQGTISNLRTVLNNELNSTDMGVYRLQIAFLKTFLISPISGTVTGVYKQPGDAVTAGDIVARVEDNSSVYLIGTVVYGAPVAIGMKATVSTTKYDAPGGTPPPIPPGTIAGTIVAARGRGADNTWDIVVFCDNTDGGEQILPLGYVFDYDDTTISITS
jgi:hypothetical protein